MVSLEAGIDRGLKAISDSTRRGILGLLRKRKLSVLEIAEEFPMSRPAISKHLRILKEAGLVLETPSGRQRLYELDRASLEPLVAWLAGFNGGVSLKTSATGARSSARVPRIQNSVKRAPERRAWRVW